MMIVSTLIAATLAIAEPAPTSAPQPAATPAPVAKKKMACCEKMKKGEGCDCCKGMEHKEKTSAPAHGGHGDHDH